MLTLPPVTGTPNARQTSLMPFRASTKERIISGRSGFGKFRQFVIANGFAPLHTTFRADSATANFAPSFGFKKQLNYKIIVNWEIAEHKSQGSMQTYMNRGDFENFWYFDINGNSGREKVKKFFEKLNGYVYK